mgnify:CR=1 FL=1
MDNGTKLSPEQIKSLMDDAETGNKEEVLKKYLSDSDAQKVRSILSDPDRLKAVLSSPFAKKLMEKLKKEKDGSD